VTVFVADVAVGQPAVEQAAVAVVGQRAGSGGAAPVPRKQAWVLGGPAGDDPVLLNADLSLELLVDRDGGLAAHLVVDIAQVGRALGVLEQAVEPQRAGVGGAETAADQDQSDQPGVGVGPAVEVGRCLELGHDVLAQSA
jgi:hypothetical protein